MTKLRRRYAGAGLEHKKKLLNQAQELMGDHRKSAIRAAAGGSRNGDNEH